MTNLPESIRNRILTVDLLIYIVAFSILLVYLLPHIYKADESVFLIHDNLDSNVVWNTVLANDSDVFSMKNEQIEGNMNSLPSGLYRSEFTYITLLYYYFEPLNAYNLNAIFLHVIAFLSALLLLSIILKTEPLTVRVGLSLSFALLPFRTSALLSIAAQPLIAAAAIYLLEQKHRIKSLALMFLFPFFSDLFLVNVFTIFGLIVFGLASFIWNRRVPHYLIVGVTLLIFGSILVHFKLFELMFLEDFQSHRSITRDILKAPLNFKGFMGTSMMTAMKGQYHFHTYPYLITLPIWILGLAFAIREKRQLIQIILCGCALISLGLANQIWDWTPFAELVSSISKVQSFNFRFISLIPFFSFLLVALSLRNCQSTIQKSIFAHASVVSLIAFTFFPFSISDVNGSTYLESPFYTNYLNIRSKEHKSFSDYYKVKAFQTIKSKFDEAGLGEKIACFGFSPSIAQMNGLQTVDGYFGLYSLEYFKDWSTMLNTEDENNFSSWGNRCYLYSNELSSDPKSRIINHLNILPEALKDVGANGILSRLPIKQIGDRKIEPKIWETSEANFETIYFYPL